MKDQDACQAVWKLLARKPDLAARLPAGASLKAVATQLSVIAGENGVQMDAQALEEAMALRTVDQPHALSDAALDVVSAGVSLATIWADHHKLLSRVTPEAQGRWLQARYGK